MERDQSLVRRIVSHAGFLEALFSQPEAFRSLMRAPLVRDDYQFEQLLASVGGDGASLHTRPSRKEAWLLNLLLDAEALQRLLRQEPTLAAAIAENPAFVEQVKVRKPHIYRALLEKAGERFSKDAGLAAEIRAERESLHCFDNEGGKKRGRGKAKAAGSARSGRKLLEAAEHGNWVVVRALLNVGADPNLQDNGGWTALMWAANRGHTDIVRALLAKGGDPNLQSNDGVSALMYAAIHGHTDAVRFLLAERADPNLQNNDGVSALMRVANRGHAAIVRALLNGGADPNLQSNGGWTALMCAAIHGHADIVRALLNGGADPNLHSKYGEKALDVAVSRGIKEMVAAAERKWRQGGQ